MGKKTVLLLLAFCLMVAQPAAALDTFERTGPDVSYQRSDSLNCQGAWTNGSEYPWGDLTGRHIDTVQTQNTSCSGFLVFKTESSCTDGHATHPNGGFGCNDNEVRFRKPLISCPANTTQSGLNCTTNEGYNAVQNPDGTWSAKPEGQECDAPSVYNPATGTCSVLTPEEACQAKNGQTATSGHMEIGYDDAGTVPLFACHSGCMVQFQGSASATHRELINGKWVYYAEGDYVHINGLNGQPTACTPGQNGLGESPAAFDPTQPKPDSGCPEGYFSVDLSTGKQCVKGDDFEVLDPDSENPPNETKIDEEPPTTNPDGSTTQRTVKTNPDGSKDITTTKTNPDGSKQITTEHVPAPGKNPLDDDEDEGGEDGECEEECDLLTNIRDALEGQGIDSATALDQVDDGEGLEQVFQDLFGTLENWIVDTPLPGIYEDILPANPWTVIQSNASGGCLLPSSVLGHSFNFDLCQYQDKVQSVLGFFLFITLLWGVMNVVFERPDH